MRLPRLLAGLGLALTAALGLVAPAEATPANQPPVLLVAGDSVAAGAGLPLVSPASPLDQACARSSQAYVYAAAAQLHWQPATVACSGATTWHGVIGSQTTAAGPAPSQLLQAYQGPQPFEVALTVGANDVNWSGFLQQCIVATCGTADDTTRFEQLLRKARAGMLVSLVGFEKLHPHRILVTGYYDPFDGSAVQPGQVGFTPDEITWYKARRDELNAMLQQVTSCFPNGRFIPLDFSGHGTEILVQGLTDPAPFHPTVAGQELIANALVAAA